MGEKYRGRAEWVKVEIKRASNMGDKSFLYYPVFLIYTSNQRGTNYERHA